MKASGSNDLTALRIKEVRKFFRSSKSIGILLGSYTRLATFTAEGNFTRSMPKDMRKALDTVEPVRIKMLVPVSASTKASASASVRRRWPSPYESCEYIRIFMLPFLLGIGVPCSCFHSACGRGTLRVRARPREPREGLGYQQDFDGSRDLSRDVRSWWPMFCTAITTSITKRTLGHSRRHLPPPCHPRKPGERPLVLHDPISVAENNESAMNPRQILGTVNRGSERTLPSTRTLLFLSPRVGRRAVSASL